MPPRATVCGRSGLATAGAGVSIGPARRRGAAPGTSSPARTAARPCSPRLRAAARPAAATRPPRPSRSRAPPTFL